MKEKKVQKQLATSGTTPDWGTFLNQSMEALSTSDNNAAEQPSYSDNNFKSKKSEHNPEINNSTNSLWQSPSLESIDNQSDNTNDSANAAVLPPLNLDTMLESKASISESTTNYYVVKFKRSRHGIYRSTEVFPSDTIVIVEADRGHDIGTIVQSSSSLSELVGKNIQDAKGEKTESNNSVSLTYAANPTDYKKIIQAATPAQKEQVAYKVMKEMEALHWCQVKVRERALDEMEVLDAEFQFDGNKLTFYFKSTKRIDFRDLVRDLYALFKTRIWLQQEYSNK